MDVEEEEEEESEASEWSENQPCFKVINNVTFMVEEIWIYALYDLLLSKYDKDEIVFSFLFKVIPEFLHLLVVFAKDQKYLKP